MCGIAGITGKIDRGIARAVVGKMIASQERRGLDGEGLEEWEGAVLGPQNPWQSFSKYIGEEP